MTYRALVALSALALISAVVLAAAGAGGTAMEAHSSRGKVLRRSATTMGQRRCSGPLRSACERPAFGRLDMDTAGKRCRQALGGREIRIRSDGTFRHHAGQICSTQSTSPVRAMGADARPRRHRDVLAALYELNRASSCSSVPHDKDKIYKKSAEDLTRAGLKIGHKTMGAVERALRTRSGSRKRGDTTGLPATEMAFLQTRGPARVDRPGGDSTSGGSIIAAKDPRAWWR